MKNKHLAHAFSAFVMIVVLPSCRALNLRNTLSSRLVGTTISTKNLSSPSCTYLPSFQIEDSGYMKIPLKLLIPDEPTAEHAIAVSFDNLLAGIDEELRLQHLMTAQPKAMVQKQKNRARLAFSITSFVFVFRPST